MPKKVVILGGGESGVGAALLAQVQGYEVFVSDFGVIDERYKRELDLAGVAYEEGGHTEERIIEADLIIKSPGIPDTAKIMRLISAHDIESIGEIEFGARYYKGRVLAITGSNGKTTTTGLLYHIVKTAGLDVQVGGNYGTSFCRLLTKDHPAYMVLEISSFQLDDCLEFQANVAAILNITPDHLDRYDYQMSKYATSKYKIASNLKGNDKLFLNADDGVSRQYSHLAKSEHIIWINESEYNKGITSTDGESMKLTISGKHNLFNAYVAVSMARAIGIRDEYIARALETFVNMPHRMEVVAVINGVTYINDSKATNVDSAYYALEGLEGPIIWIAGGTDKGNDYGPLLPVVKDKVKALICLGVDNQKLKNYFAPYIRVILETTKVSEVLKLAQEMVVSGDTVLLSPACASFDLFTNYEDRGDQFKEAVSAYQTKMK